jgi:Aromatic acid exporter family member 1
MAALRNRLKDPVVWGNAVQLAKTVGAAVIAWVLARSVFGLAQPFLAPWAALLTVHATVYRTFARGLQQVAGAVLGVLLAFAAGAAVGVNAASLAFVLLVALAAGTTRALRDESTTAAATALVVLLAGYSADTSMLGERLLDTVIGIAVGLLVNLLVWPPLRDRTAARQVDVIDDRLGALLSDIARAMQEGRDAAEAEQWVERTRELDQDIASAWAVFRQARESGRLNLRRAAAARVDASHGLVPLLARLEQAVADTRSMAGTIGRAGSSGDWDPRFREKWVDLVSRAGAAVSEADAAAITRVREDLESAAREWFRAGAAMTPGPVHGALIVNLRNILEAMDAVAEAQPVRVDARQAVALSRRPESVV